MYGRLPSYGSLFGHGCFRGVDLLRPIPLTMGFVCRIITAALGVVDPVTTVFDSICKLAVVQIGSVASNIFGDLFTFDLIVGHIDRAR